MNGCHYCGDIDKPQCESLPGSPSCCMDCNDTRHKCRRAGVLFVWHERPTLYQKIEIVLRMMRKNKAKNSGYLETWWEEKVV